MSKAPGISAQLRQAIRNYPGSAYALAAAARVPRSAVTRFASGKRGLTVETLEKLAAALKLRLAPIAPRASRHQPRPVEADQGGDGGCQTATVPAMPPEPGPAVEKLGIYWRAGRPFLHLRVNGRAVAIEEHQQSPAHTEAGLVYVGLLDLPSIRYHVPGSTSDVVTLRGYTADPATARLFREFLAYCKRRELWPPESERGAEVIEVKTERPADDEAGEE